MNPLKTILVVIIIMSSLTAKNIYFTRLGNISFYSSALLEDIEAINKQVTCVLNMDTKEIAFRVPIHGFIFKNGLMQDHFNENYLESEKFPTATFKGKILGLDSLKLSEKPQEVILSGDLTIHGISQEIRELGEISMKDGNIFGIANFNIKVADYEIEIPKIVREKIAKIVEISVKLNLKKK
ncbi:MAG: YceI family protein [Candidatus Marinimicrobia bacterium]|jgi:hypothetical protein|nr:YceI family protein [Candidatus Neomarinimicrobiota bacterium]MBT3501675.1 YceI family protein [Candidatus Neomarinimicrobiota bacterium]MBT3839853.1 YceI family protein [Candidatus Neomarinimicrobiota bacterium]MBT3998441.1 YceI family protein [Candidatus Neomarinimicrobiota bacterium]MBT4580184.1 YceI family protein [Candidatus Neomarinimicrobiota bacterium]